MTSDVIEIDKCLPTTALNTEHPRSVEMKAIAEEMAAAAGGSLEDFSVSRGVATLRVKGDGVSDKIVTAFKAFPGVEVQTLSVLASFYKKNVAAQKRADAMKEKKKNKK